MKILPMTKSQCNNTFEGNPIRTKNSKRAVKNFTNNNVIKNNRFRQSAFGIMTAIGLTALTLLGACKKDENKPATTENKDLIDIAFKNYVDLFNLDTIGQTKVLKHSYVLNAGDSLVEKFDYPTNPDELHANGIYYYNGSDPFISREHPFTSTWTRTLFNGQDAIKAEYKYDWENTKNNELPEPQEIYYMVGKNKIYAHPGTGNCLVDVDIKNDSAYFALEDTIKYKTPFTVKIKENY